MQTFSKKICLTLLSILAYLNSQLTYFDQKTFKHFQASHLHMNLGILFKCISHFTNDINYCKIIKRFLLLDFHCEFHFPVYFMHTEYNSG